MIRGNDPILLTPGPLTTSLETRQAMLRDWGSWDASFNAITATVCKDVVDVVNGAGTHVCVPLQGSGTFAVEAMITSFVPKTGKLLVLINGAYGQRALKIAQIAGRAGRHQRDGGQILNIFVKIGAGIDDLKRHTVLYRKFECKRTCRRRQHHLAAAIAVIADLRNRRAVQQFVSCIARIALQLPPRLDLRMCQHIAALGRCPDRQKFLPREALIPDLGRALDKPLIHHHHDPLRTIL